MVPAVSRRGPPPSQKDTGALANGPEVTLSIGIRRRFPGPERSLNSIRRSCTLIVQCLPSRYRQIYFAQRLLGTDR